MTRLPLVPEQRTVEVEIDGAKVRVREGETLLDACGALGIDTPTLCFAKNLTPVNVCRVCVVELEGARTLVPSCSRKAEAGMKVSTKSERVTTSRKVVLELLASSIDTSAAPELVAFLARYGGDAERFGPRDTAQATAPHAPSHAGHHEVTDGRAAATKLEAPTVDNELFVRDYAKCILCYKCVEACGNDAQNTFAIAVAGRGFEARIATELERPLTDSACVFCGNCIGVCPTGALVFSTEHAMRNEGSWDETKQTQTKTVCPYCGVGCVLELHVQDDAIVKVTSPNDSSVTEGHLCIKGRFGWQYVGERKRP